ncbi:MAG TPA: hypothetical protein VFC82_08565 [Actinomycetaceae bacterium]|nr:hypothetical protein [Actinomycetaceae bacterium]
MTADGVWDSRRPAYGPGRILILVYAIFAVAALARSTVQLIRDASEAPVAYGLSLFAAVVYVLATIGLAHNGRRMRRLAWVAVGMELVGVLTVGTLSLLRPDLFPRDTVWSHFGSGYGFVPLVLPFVGIWWLWTSSPVRISRLAEGLPARRSADQDHSAGPVPPGAGGE